jgi:CubicO group peptidase (beta-lactamase class C family)
VRPINSKSDEKIGSAAKGLLMLALAASLFDISSDLRAAGETTNADIVGLWCGRVNQGSIGGELRIDTRKSEWRATISGVSAPVQRNENAVNVALPNNAGEFRGHFVHQRIVGHWIQPPSDVNNNRNATPVELVEVSRHVWQGQVNPLATTLTFGMSIQPASDGSIGAVVRNRELNLFRRDTYRIEIHDRELAFSDTKNPSNEFKAQFSSEKQLLLAALPNLDRSVEFQRVNADEAIGFYARAPKERRYIYKKPNTQDDGWATASLVDVGIDEKLIDGLIEKILAADPLNNSLTIHSLLIARHGKLALEEYFYGFKSEQLHEMRSASKTFTPLLVGIAHEHGAKIDINTPVYSQFPEYKDFANPDPRKQKITIRNLMTMTSGLCDDNDEKSPGNEDVMQQQKAQPDWYKYTLDLPMARDPGGDQAVYCSAGINLLGGIVRNATHTWLPEFFYENVAKPLQIKTYHWNLMPTGDGYAGGGLYLRPRDQLKLGQLYLNGGVWNGKRVIGKDWVERSTTRQSTFGQTLGADHDYGYGWHLYHFDVGGHTYRAYAAGGNGWQIVMNIPDLDLVVGFTGGAYGEFPKWYKWQSELVPQFIIPAVASR